MSYAPGAPATVWQIPTSVLDAGAKLTLMAMWSRADHDAQRSPEPTTVWFAAVLDATPAMSLLLGLALATGATVRAVRQHLTKLRRLGLVSTCGRLVTLTPGCHVCHCGGELCHCSVDARMAESDAVAASHDAVASQADAVASLQLNPPAPPIPPSPGEDARPPSESDTGKPRTLDTRTPAKQPPRHTPGPGAPELPGHVERSLARAQRRPVPGPKLSPFEARVYATSPAAAQALDWPNWTRSLGEARAALTLTDDEIIAVLEAWPGEPRSERPDMDKLWFRGKSRDWIKLQLARIAPPASGHGGFGNAEVRAMRELAGAR